MCIEIERLVVFGTIVEWRHKSCAIKGTGWPRLPCYSRRCYSERLAMLCEMLSFLCDQTSIHPSRGSWGRIRCFPTHPDWLDRARDVRGRQRKAEEGRGR